MILLLLIMLYDDAIIFEIESKNDLEAINREIEVLKNEPINVNKAEVLELTRIPFLSIGDGMRIVDYRRQYGEFRNINELLNVPGIDRILFERIAPFITVTAKKITISRYQSRIRWQRLFPDSTYPDDCYLKNELNFDPYLCFFISEKDRHESSFFDYYAAGLMLEENERRLAIGRYNLDLGKGVLLSQNGSFIYGNDVRLQVRERGIMPYTSVIENGGFFGVALSDSIIANFTIFYSNQKIDARIDTNGYAYSFFEGDHVDSASRSYKDRLNEELIGYDINCRIKKYRIASRTYFCKYEPAFTCTDSMRGFYGDRFWISGIDLDYYGRSFVIFSEAARSHQDRIGGIFGLSNSIDIFDFTGIIRCFPVGFYSPKGIESKNGYLGGIFEISSRNKVCNFSADLDYEKNAETDSMLYRFDITLERKVSFLTGRLQMNWRYASHFDRAGSAIFIRLKPYKFFFCDFRLEDKYVYAQESVYQGLIGCLEVGFERKYGKLRLRYGVFDTDNYQARLNVYEIDLPGVINNRAIYDQGDYGFIHVSAKFSRFFTFTGKYSIMRRDSEADHKIGAQIDMRS